MLVSSLVTESRYLRCIPAYTESIQCLSLHSSPNSEAGTQQSLQLVSPVLLFLVYRLCKTLLKLEHSLVDVHSGGAY